MKSSLLVLAAVSFSVFVWAGSDLAPANGPAVIAANLDTLRFPGKIDGVLWTRRTHMFTLQVLIPRGDGRKAAMPEVDAWLLRSDGSRIEPMGKLARECPRFGRCGGSEAEFTFPLSVGGEAVRAVVSVDGLTRDEALVGFPD